MLNLRLYGRSVRQFFNAILMSVFCLHPVWADDTEIFFGPFSGKEIQPNIVFLLDASLSMDFRDCLNGQQFPLCAENQLGPTGQTTRIERMNAAMTEILTQAERVNIGLMRFSNTFAGARVIYPVSDVEQHLCDGAPCENNTEFPGVRSTVKQELIDVATNLDLQFRTPTVGAMEEAARYFLGEPVLYGKKRWLGAGNPANHPTERGFRSRVSHPDSYTGGTGVLRDDEGLCTDADLSHESCSEEEILGSPQYISPINNECQANHLILVTDGASNHDNGAEQLALERVGTCPTYVGNSGQCAVEIADFLYQSEQQVVTHTLGFNLQSQWLEDIAITDAEMGDLEGTNSRYYEASSTQEFVDAVFSIIEGIDETESTFVAPGATIDQFSRLSHRSEVYLSLFQPSETPGWQGNLKRYSLTGDVLRDANGVNAVDPATGEFNPESTSFWTGFEDGADITIGGAASKLDHITRKAVTYTGTSPALFNEVNALSSDNDSLNIFLEGDAVNVAPQGTASQSSTGFGGVASRAIDNDTNGIYWQGSVTHSENNGTLHWWEVALAEQVKVEKIVLHNRTDCCSGRLNNVHVFVSNTPFGTATLDELLAQPTIWHQFLPGALGTDPIEVQLPVSTTGRYVRVQLAQGDAALSLAEVEVFGVESALLAEKENLIDWIRGRDVKDENSDGNTNDNRLHMGDPLHSTSVTVTYGGDAADPDSVVFVGTNEGYLHAVSSRTGIEEFAFMPEPLVNNIETLFQNSPGADKVYGMDGDLTLWVNDDDGNGVIDADTSDHAFLYAGMRRGGEQYYALDVTNRSNPTFMFSIPDSDPAAFAELGQTWSKPVQSQIQVGTEVRDVLIFAGGYDESQDDKATRLPDTKGRAMYIVDALNGSVIWSGQPTAAAGGSTKAFPAMQYSIPSDITVIENEGLASQIYVGDMGGQLWRFDIPNDGETGADLVDGGVIAVLSEPDKPEATRRFFHAPDLVLSKFEGKSVLNIGIGSGYRAHPLNTEIKDNFYMIRYPFKATGNYGYDVNDDGTTFEPIEMGNLYDATENLIDGNDAAEVTAERAALESAEGWFINMERNGEKILGSSSTLEGVVRFISYVPGTQNLGACLPDIGDSFFYTVNIADGTPVDNRDEKDKGTPLTPEDRWRDVPGGGLAPPVKTIFVKTDDGVTPTNVSGINVLEELDNVDTQRRWYWAETPE